MDTSVREPLPAHDGKSGACLERTTLDGRPVVVKHFDLRSDWIARATGELRSRHVLLWEAGLLDRLPGCLDHVTVGCHEDTVTRRAEIVLRDVTPWLVPPRAVALSARQHRQFLTHMAALHAGFWGFTDEIGLLPLSNRYLTLSPWIADAERAGGRDHPIPTRRIPDGWGRLAAEAPHAGPVALDLVEDLGPLLEGLEGTPQTLLHGDWKGPNLGIGPDGRTILLDWSLAGRGPACADLAWYLAINGRQLPESNDASIDAYRGALAAYGIETAGWWDAQLALSLIGAFVLLGWDMVVDSSPALGWWDERVADAVSFLP